MRKNSAPHQNKALEEPHGDRALPGDKSTSSANFLVSKSPSAGGEGGPKVQTLADRYLIRIQNHRIVAVLLVAGTVIGGVAKFTDSVSKVAESIPKLLHLGITSPPIPGDSGWLLLGDLDPSGSNYVRGPFFDIYRSSYSDKSLIPRIGEQLRLTAERNVIIAGYKKSGLAAQNVPPWTLNVLTDSDYTGVKLPKGSVVEVRSVSLGSFPFQTAVVWVRVAAPPK